MAHHHCYFITLLALCFVIQVSWAKYCIDDDDCPVDWFCISNSCEGISGRCKGDFDCGIHEQCIGQTCQPRCISSDECPGSQICWIGTCTYCYGDSECLIGEICQNQACVTGCRRYSSTCSVGEKCINNICQLPSSYGPCEYDSDCLGSQVCQFTRCEEPQTRKISSGVPSSLFAWIIIVMIVIAVVKCILFVAYRSSRSHSRIVVPPPPSSRPVTTCNGVIPLPNHPVAIRPCQIQITASAPSLEPAFDAKPPSYNEIAANTTPCTPPPQYSNLPPNFPK